MLPELFRLGPLPVRSFGLFLIIAVVVAVLVAIPRAKAKGLGPSQIWDAAFWTVIAGVFGARLFFILQELPYYLKNPKQIFSLNFAGLTSFGGILFGALALMIFARRSKIKLLDLLDIAAVPFLVASAIGRVGCLLNGCCHGGPTALPWGVHVEGLKGIYHPAQIYESMMLISLAILLMIIERRNLVTGQSLALSICFFGIARFIYEFWRAGSSSTYIPGISITQAQIVALVMILVGIVLFFKLRKKEFPTVTALQQ